MAAKKTTALTAEERLEKALVPTDEQPYEVPENWCWTKLEKVSDVIMGQSPAGTDTTDNSSFTTLIGGAADMGELYPKVSRYTKKPTKLSQAGDIIICIRATLGRPIFSDGAYCLGRGVAALRSEVVSCEFLRLLLINQEQYLYDNATGTTFAQVTGNTLCRMPIPLPPLAEQKRIVATIEELFFDLDKAAENAQSIIDNAESRRSAILHQAFTGKLTVQWRNENNIGYSSWTTSVIGDIADVKGGKRVPKGMSLTSENTGHPYIKAGNLKCGTVIDDGIMFVPDDVLQFIKNYTVSAGDVYITNVGACIGDCGVIPPKYDGANLTENAVKITNLKCNGSFLAYFLATNQVQGNIKALIASATLGKLSIANIKTIEVNLPTLAEQQEIVRILNELLGNEQRIKDAAEEMLHKIAIMKKSILADAFRGKLGTNDSTDEPATELLKQILA